MADRSHRHPLCGCCALNSSDRGNLLFEDRSVKPLIFALSAALFSTDTALADNIRTERVHFKEGATSAAAEGQIKGYEGVD